MKIILASNSPRRKEILNGMGLSFEVLSPDCDENIFEKNPKNWYSFYPEKKRVPFLTDTAGTKPTFCLSRRTRLCA